MKNSKKKEKMKSLLHDAIFALFVIILDRMDFYSKLFNPVMNDVASLIKFIYNNSFCICIIIIILALATILCRHNISKNILDVNFNKLDSFTVNLCIVATTLIAWFMCIQESGYKIIACIWTASILATFVVARAIIRSVYRKIPSRSDVITLADLYNGHISNGSKFILIEDSESEEDIYDRDVVIEKILNVMRCKNGDSSFTASLVGPWGSGKSTILKYAKKQLSREDKKKKTIIIDDFEPWLYDDSETMAKEFSTLLFSKLEHRFSSRRVRDFAKQFLGTVSEIEPSGLLKYLPIKENEANPTEVVNDYLTGHNKKLIIIIDNLERCKTELIIDFLKMIKRGLNFKNTLYILSYDSKIMEEILEKNQINKKYLEKFSQMTIVVPRIDDQKNKEVTTQCFKNYLEQLGENPEEYREMVNHITEYIKTPRELLLAINSVYAGKNEYVNPIDSIILNILNRETPRLYSLIEQNEYNFVHNESIMRADMMNSDNDRKTIEQYCKVERDFFVNALKNDESLSNEVASHYALIRFIFPNINFFFLDNPKFDSSYAILNNKKEMILKARKERRLRTSNFFSAYFTGAKNDYVKAADIVDTFVKDQTKEACKKLLRELLWRKTIIQSYVFQQINERVDELKNETVDNLAYFLIDSFSIFNESAQPLFLSVKDESYLLLSELIQKVDEATFEQIEKKLMSDYRNLRLIRSLSYWMENGNGMDEEYSKRYTTIKKNLETMKDQIIQKRINMYSPKRYQRFAVHLLGEKEVIIKYLQSIKAKTPKRRQILILADFINQGYSSKNEYFYEIDHNILDKVYSKNEILDIIKKSNNGELKSIVKEIIDGEKVTLQTASLDSKTYSCNENYDLNRMAAEYAKRLDSKVEAELTHE